MMVKMSVTPKVYCGRAERQHNTAEMWTEGAKSSFLSAE
jgi:hypothetical protein